MKMNNEEFEEKFSKITEFYELNIQKEFIVSLNNMKTCLSYLRKQNPI